MIDLGDDCPELLARCEETPDWTLGKFADRACAFVADFVALHPMFADMRLCGRSAKDSPPLLSDLSNLRPWILERGWSSDPPSPYTNLDAAGKPTVDSSGSVGFSLSLTNAKDWDGKVDLSVRRAGTDGSGMTSVITLARKDNPQFRNGPLPLKLIELMVRHWPVKYASYGLGGWNRKVNFALAPDQRGPIEAGWLTYVADPSIAVHLPPGVEPKPLGRGVVFQLTPQISRYDDDGDVALGRDLKARLDASGLYARAQ